MPTIAELLPDVITSIITAFLPWLIPNLYKELQRQKLNSLNRYLICDSNPSRYIEIWPCHFFWVKMASLLFTALTAGALVTAWLWKPNEWWIWCGIPAVSLWILYGVMCGPLCNKDVKGLVGIIAPELKGVADIPAPNDNSIYFATHDIPGGGVYSYEERMPITDPEEIAKIREDKIVAYYRELRTRIDGKANDKSLFMLDVPGKGIMHVCDFMTDCAYSTDRLVYSINCVSNNIVNDNSINFIGDKVGVESFSIDNGYLTLGIYLTDHFTFKVFKHLFKEGPYKECFQLLIRRINRAGADDKALICRCLKFLFSSFGLDIIVFGQKADRSKGVMLAVRAGKIEQNRQSKIHVPVNESFSLTDIKPNNHFSLKDCALRGIEEELGIPQSYLNDDILRFNDFAIVSDEGEIGLGCSADFSKIMTLEEATLFPGQDKFLEIKELFVLDMPPFKWDPRKYPDYFYFKTDNSTLTTPWESFTPLLYQRLAVREQRLSQNLVNAISFITLIVILLLIEYTFNLTSIDYISETVCYGISFVVLLGKLVSDFVHRRPKRIRPLVAQWNGDARCLQSINTALGDSHSKELKERNPVMWHMMFGLDRTEELPSGNVSSLSDLRLTDAPWCAVRHELVKNHAESPVSFYPVRFDADALEDNSISIVELPLSYAGGQLRLTISCKVENGKWNYGFTKSVKSPQITFDSRMTAAEVQSYSRLFGVSPAFLERMLIGRFDLRFCNEYTLYDLFSYRDKFYWSALRNKPERDGDVHEINAKSDIFRDFIGTGLNDSGHGFEVTIQGPADIMLKKLSKFIAHPQNRPRISSLDIYMLQLALARMGTNLRPLLLVGR